MTPSDRSPSPSNPGFWSLVAGAVLLLAGGLFTATIDFGYLRQIAQESVSDQAVRDALLQYRGIGGLCVLGGALLLGLALRARNGDPRVHRATIALALTIVVLIGAGAALGVGGIHVLSLLSLPPIIVGALLGVRPREAESNV